MLKSNVCVILSFSESRIHPLTIVSYLLHQSDSYSGLKVNFSEAFEKEWGMVDINVFVPKVDFLLYIHAKQLR